MKWMLMFVLSLAACTGTETGNPPLRGFDQTGCKSGGSLDKGVHLQDVDVAAGLNNPLYEGRACFVWTRLDDHTLRIDFTNFNAGCGENEFWKPEVEKSGDEVLLVLDNRGCNAAACDNYGGCHYDVSFTIEVEDFSQDLPVRLVHRFCDEAPDERSAILAVSKKQSGAVCTYASYREPGRDQSWPCNSPYAPGLQCRSPLQCADAGLSYPICLPSCTTDADCDSLDHCQDSVCQLREIGVTVTRM